MPLLWYGEKFDKKARAQIRRNVIDACLEVEGTAKGLMSRGGRTESGAAVVKPGAETVMIDPETGGSAKKVNSYRSKPGEPPRVQTGRLRASITHEIHPTLPVGRVGTNVKYGKFLEFGTRRMAPRPWLRVALALAQDKIKQIMSRKVR